MSGVFFVVVSDREARTVKHVRIDRVAGSRRVSVALAADEQQPQQVVQREFDGLSEALSAMRRPLRLKHPLVHSRYWTALEQELQRRQQRAVDGRAQRFVPLM